MTTIDTANWTKATYTKGNGDTFTDASFWNYGKEIWCNKQGRYTTIVADLTQLVAPYQMSLCNVAIMGTKYVRDISSGYGAPLSSIALGSGLGTVYYRYNDISPDKSLPIGNSLDIGCR